LDEEKLKYGGFARENSFGSAQMHNQRRSSSVVHLKKKECNK